MKNKTTPIWQRITSSVLVPVILTHLSFPVYASVTQSVTLEKIKEVITASPRYKLEQSVQQYLHTSALESQELGVFDGFEFFFNELVASTPEAFSEYRKTPDSEVQLEDLPPRFGSPYVERGVIRDQLIQILNKAWISHKGWSNDNSQIQGLYANAATYASLNGLKFGQRLTASQIKALPQDMVWPELRTIGEQAYVIPFVYLTNTTIAEQKLSESTLAAGSANLESQTFIVNGSRVEFKYQALIDVKNDFINTLGTVSGQKLTIRTGRELQNLSGTITGDDVTLIAGKLVNDTLVTRLDYGHGFSESFNEIGTISSLGDLTIHTAGDVSSHGGNFSSQGDLTIQAGGNIILVPQTAQDQREESGALWSDQESSLVNLQTNLSAIDTLSLIAGGQVYIEGAILESQGLLEILAGYGITLKSAADLTSYQTKFESDSGGLFGSKESESESKTEAEIVRTLLKAGQSMVLNTTQGNVLLQAVTIDNKGVSQIIAENGSIDFELAKLLETYSHEQSFEGALSFRHAGEGYQREVAYYSEFINNGGLILDGATGVRIEVATGTKGLDATLRELAKSPELAWMQELRNDPALQDVDWQTIELVLEQWEYDESGLSAAAMAILAIALAVVMGPGGLAIAGAGSGALITATGVTAAAINAGFSAIVLQASASLLANGFDIEDTLQDLSSKETLTSVATSMVTAGVISAIDSSLFVPTGTEEVSSVTQLTGFASGTLEHQALQQLIHTTASSGLHAIANGNGWDEFGDSLVQGIAVSSIALLGKELATKIGDLSRAKEIDQATQYIAHAALGCALGSLTSAANGTNSSEVKKGCASGVTGGVIGEYVASQYLEDIGDLKRESETFTRKVVDNLINEKGLEGLDQETINREIQRLHKLGADISRLVAGITVFALGGNVDIAMNSAGNAAENNALQLLLVLLVSKESLALISAILLAAELKDLAMNGLVAYEKGAKLYDLYVSGDPAQQEQAKQEMIALAVELSQQGAVALIEGVVVNKITAAAMATKTFEELAEVLSSQLRHVNSHDAAEVFEQMGRNVEFKNKQWQFYQDNGGTADYTTWSKAYDSDTLSALKNQTLFPDSGVLANKPDMSVYLKYKEQYPNTSISQERFIEQWEEGFTIGKSGSWKRREVRKANIPEDQSYRAVKEVTKVNDHSEFLKEDVTLPSGKSLSVEQALQDRQTLVEEVRALKQQPEGSFNKDTLLTKEREIREYSESIGQADLEFGLKKEFAEVTPLQHQVPGKGKSGQFDGVYLVKDHAGNQSLVAAEAKGGLNPTYGTRQVGKSKEGQIIDAQQGSDQYQQNIWQNMQSKYDAAIDNKDYGVDSLFTKQVDQLGETLDLFKSLNPSGKLQYRGSELLLAQDGNIKHSNKIIFKTGGEP